MELDAALAKPAPKAEAEKSTASEGDAPSQPHTSEADRTESSEIAERIQHAKDNAVDRHRALFIAALNSKGPQHSERATTDNLLADIRRRVADSAALGVVASERDDLRAQLAAVTEERDALRRVIDLLHSDATAIRAARAREVAAIDAMVARAKEATNA